MKGKVWAALLVVGALLAAAPAMAQGETRAAAAGGSGQAVEAQLVIDGQVVGGFTEVSGLSIEVEQVATLCPTGGGACDDTAWGTAVLRSVWAVDAAAAELESSAWLSTRARHDIAMNAIRNIRARVSQLEERLADPAATLKTKHDTVKNAIGNVRMALAVLTDTTAQEPGVDQAALGRLAEAVRALQPLEADWALRYRPGRPTYGNITFVGPQGSAAALMDWYRKVLAGQTERKSGSIILLDRSGGEVARYNFFEAWPCRYKAGFISEELEFAVEKVERASK